MADFFDPLKNDGRIVPDLQIYRIKSSIYSAIYNY